MTFKSWAKQITEIWASAQTSYFLWLEPIIDQNISHGLKVVTIKK